MSKEYEFKGKNVNKKSKNPMVFRVREIDWDSMSFEEKIQFWLKDSKERCKGIKTEFISNTEEGKMALRQAKKRISIEKRQRRYE